MRGYSTLSSYIIITIITVYLIILILFGYIGYKKTLPTIEDIFIARGTLGSLIIFLTSLATAFSAFAFLGAAGYFYSYGVNSVAFMSPVVADLVIMAVIGQGIWLLGKRYNYVTPADLLADRYYSNIVRLLVAAYCIFFSIFYIGLQFIGCGYIMETLTGGMVPYSLTIIYVAIFIAIYVVLGGMRAVAYTDALQACLLLSGMIVISGLAVTSVGPGIFHKAIEISPKWATLTLPPQYIYSCFLGIAISMPVWPQLWVRYYAAKKLKSGVTGVVLGEGIGVITTCTIFAALIGAGGLVLWPGLVGLEADRVAVKFLGMVNPVIAAGLGAAAFAAAMSTADSIILLLGSVFVRDIVQKIVKPTITIRVQGIIARLVCLILTVLAIIFALHPPGMLVEIAFRLAWPGVATFIPPLLGALYWRRATREGAILSLLTGVVAVVLTTFVWPDALGIYSTIWGVGLGMVSLILVSYMTPPPPESVIMKFHGFLDNARKYIIDTEEDVKKIPEIMTSDVREKGGELKNKN